MNQELKEEVLTRMNASGLEYKENIQRLWSGYGTIDRYILSGKQDRCVVIKHILFPSEQDHPRGWNSSFSHERKVKSYEVEIAWYKYAREIDFSDCLLPKALCIIDRPKEKLIVMQDLIAFGYPKVLNEVRDNEMRLCVEWMANFHAKFCQKEVKDLWEIGTYWHLDTRPEELEKLSDKRLKKHANVIDEILSKCKYQTLVHGDAKLANFLFSEKKDKVSGVDFQYIGRGCGMKDLAYFVGSCRYEEECEKEEKKILDWYFKSFRKAIKKRGDLIGVVEDIEKEWREMYAFAWADFHRFLKGWSPGHWKINSYSERVCREVMDKIEGKQ